MKEEEIMKKAIIGAVVGILGLGTTYLVSTVPGSAVGTCSASKLKGTYTFDAVGYAPSLPAEIAHMLETPVNFGSVIPLHAIGHAKFDGNGKVTGYIQENVGGTPEEEVPFVGEYELHAGPNGVGCTGVWKLQDSHKLEIFKNEGPHFFRITTGRESKMFHFITFGGGPGPVVLSGAANLDTK